ncbi:MAG TPA: LapA family protein [Candidatus Binatia bacterium]|nr:LapA family protein [Candidatus Binatia bacterium]
MIAVYVVMAVIGAAMAVFALQNLDPVVIRFVTWRIQEVPLAVVILISIVTGLTFASLVGFVQHFKLRRRIRQLEAQIRRAAPPAAPVAPAVPGAPSRPEPPSDHGFR